MFWASAVIFFDWQLRQEIPVSFGHIVYQKTSAVRRADTLNIHHFSCPSPDISTQVDVSETFSADQLWFRILSGVSALFITWKSLNSADSTLNSAENGNFQS